MKKKAVIILSGGLDSTTCMGIAKKEGFDLFPITFNYGQRHNKELECAKKVSEFYDVSDLKIVDISFLKELGGSSLTDFSLDVRENNIKDDIPNTYVPARNLIFISLATAYAEIIEAESIYIGVNVLDYSGYPDCRPEFIYSTEKTINLATKLGVSNDSINLQSPLMNMNKQEIVQIGTKLGVPYELTTSCYNGKEKACGVCDSCLLRIKGFRENQLLDPIQYETLNV